MESQLESAVERQSEARSSAEQKWYLDGMTDAAFGELPKYNFDAYLMGYARGIKQLPSLNGRVVYGLTGTVSEDDEF